MAKFSGDISGITPVTENEFELFQNEPNSSKPLMILIFGKLKLSEI